MTFLVDTGADSTVLMPIDSNWLNINFSNFGQSQKIESASGKLDAIFVRAELSFIDDLRGALVYPTSIFVAIPKPELKDVPSLLGRDILNYWVLTMAEKVNVLTADPHTVSVPIHAKSP